MSDWEGEYFPFPRFQGLPARSSVKTTQGLPARSVLKTTQGLPARSSVKTGHWPVFRALLTHWIIFRAYLTHRTVFRALLTPSGAFGIRRMNRRTYFESVSVRSPAPWDAFLRYFVLCHCARLCFFYYSCVSHGRDEPAAAAFSRKRRFPLLKAKK